MNPKNDDEKLIGGMPADSAEAEEETVDLFEIARSLEEQASAQVSAPSAEHGEMVDLFELAAHHGVLPAPAAEDIFYIGDPEQDDTAYPGGFDEADESFYTDIRNIYDKRIIFI